MKKFLIPILFAGGLLALTMVIFALDRPVSAGYQVNGTNDQTLLYRQTQVYGRGGRGGMMGGYNNQQLLISTDLSGSDYDTTKLKAVLDIVLLDEYKARAEYQAIVDKFGNENPYVNLVYAETRHIEALTRIYDAFDFVVPADTGKNFVVLPASLEASYQVGINAEKVNIALYETYLDTNLPDSIERIFQNLQNASENHLAIFTAYQNGDEILPYQNGTQNPLGANCPMFGGRQGRGNQY
ncbi:MAG: hypothetical protein FD133_322 [Erysipelotrichaceae bacterium]|nr:MAG: hypothetical protein FD133_322 [Erysipelotrichaceae bacterium]